MDNSQVGLAGEFYVLAQLAHRGLVGTLTLSNTKGVDILVTNQEIRRFFKVEVKTTTKPASRERLFGTEPSFKWPMHQKHELIQDSDLYYIFVCLQEPVKKPRFFIVPSKIVADYVRTQHEFWLKTRSHEPNETTMRRFRIQIDDPDGYEDNWAVFFNS